jgi:hypothetical protein
MYGMMLEVNLDQVEVGRQADRRPSNRGEADNTWVLNPIWDHLLLVREVRQERCDEDAP